MRTLLWIMFGICSCGVLVLVWALCVVASWADEDMEKAMRQRRGSGP